MEDRFSADFTNVRIHTDPAAASSAHDIHAHAYTVGHHIVFGTGHYQPTSPTGLRTLAHELTHVLQQRTTTITPSQPLTISHPADAGEREAESVANGPVGGTPIGVKPVHARDSRGGGDHQIVRSLQATAGNTAVARLIADAQSPSPFIQKGCVEARIQRDDMDDPRFGPNAFGRPEPAKPANADDTCRKPNDITEAEDWIISKESEWRPTAKNPASSAFGLGQLLEDNRVKYLGAKADSTDCDDQIRAFREYVKDTYRTAERAKQFWQATSAKDASKAPKGLQDKARIWIKNKWVGY